MANLKKYFVILMLIAISLESYGDTINGKEVGVKWRDGETVWYEARYLSNLKQKNDVTNVIYPNCAKDTGALKLNYRYGYGNRCSYDVKEETPWVSVLAMELKHLHGENKTRIPEKKLNEYQLLKKYEQIKKAYLKHCPSQDYDIYFGLPEMIAGQLSQKHDVEQYVYTKFVFCMEKKGLICPEGYLLFGPKPETIKDSIPGIKEDKFGCIKLKAPESPYHSAKEPELKLQCHAGGCVDYSKTESTGSNQIMFFDRSWGNRAIMREDNYNKYYCKVSKAGSVTNTCESYTSYVNRVSQERAHKKQEAHQAEAEKNQKLEEEKKELEEKQEFESKKIKASGHRDNMLMMLCKTKAFDICEDKSHIHSKYNCADIESAKSKFETIIGTMGEPRLVNEFGFSKESINKSACK